MKKLICSMCDENKLLIEFKEVLYCGFHVREVSFVCADCNERHDRDDGNETENGTVCNICNDNYTECYSCNAMKHNNNMHWCNSCERDYCDNCNCGCENDEGVMHRDVYEDSKLYLTEINGERIRATAKIGVEIECNNFVSPQELLLPRHVGVVGDGSIGYSGAEIVTPPAQGMMAEKLITDICNALKVAGAKVSNNCGLHIHIDGTMLQDDLAAIKRLMQLYITFEEVIMSFLPTSRRGNQYSQPLAKYFSVDELHRIRTYSQLERMWYRVETQQQADRLKEDKYNESRYRGLNMHSFFKSGHFEVRYHSGTTNADKIINWCALHIAMLEVAKRGNYELAGVIGEPNLKYKTDRLFMVLRLSKSIEQFYLNRQKLFSRENPDMTNNESIELFEQPIVTATVINIQS